jgi:hypothetical protein
MTKAVKSEFQKVLKLIVDTVEKRLSHLPPREAAAARKKIHQIALEAGLRGRAKFSKPAPTRARRPTPRSRPKAS